jgi:hypothetical protein
MAERAPRMATDDILHPPGYESIRNPSSDQCLESSVVGAIRSYLRDVAEDFWARDLALAIPRDECPQTIVDAAFTLLTHREFTYLSKARAQPYRAVIVGRLTRDVTAGRPLRFYYDIGGGYRAGTDFRRRTLSFSPGLGELLALRQITRFDRRVREVYPPGAKFWLVVDDVCARLVNDIPPHQTATYCRELRGMIRTLQLEPEVELLVESEYFSPEDYSVDTREVSTEVPSSAAVENVARFLGRECDVSEAIARIARYRVVSDETERRLQSRIDGVRLTQRATASTFAFRSFPGSDSRLQSGDVILAYRHHDRIEPRLLTSQSARATRVHSLDVSDLLPLPGKQVGYLIATGSGP